MQAKLWPIGGRIRHWKSFISEALWLTWCTCYKNSVTFWTNANINMCVPLPLTDIQQGLLDICAGYMKTGKSCTKKRSTHSLRVIRVWVWWRRKKKTTSSSQRDFNWLQDQTWRLWKPIKLRSHHVKTLEKEPSQESTEREMWSVKKVWVIREKRRYKFDEKPPAFPWSLPTERGVKTWACAEMCKSQVK